MPRRSRLRPFSPSDLTHHARMSLRTTFDESPELYDRTRPVCPPALFDDLVATLPTCARVLEIGCGTGQATVPLAERGLAIVCVELGGSLAAFARRKLARFAAVEVAHSS
jgi:protein-L-isoaspartate O-methyltransferase